MLGDKGIFKVNFDESVKAFKTKDGIIAIIYYVYYMMIIYLFGLLMYKTNTYRGLKSFLNINNDEYYKFLFYIPLTLLAVIPIIALIKMRKQSLRSVGLKSDKALKSIFLGFIFSLPLTIPSIIDAISQGKSIMNLTSLIWLFLYFLIEIAFVEEISFRGFIQTRIQGLIRSKWLSIIVVGIMFSVMHIPFQMIRANVPLNVFIINDSIHLIVTCIIHIYLVYLYTRDNNIVSTSIAHTLIDFTQFMFI